MSHYTQPPSTNHHTTSENHPISKLFFTFFKPFYPFTFLHFILILNLFAHPPTMGLAKKPSKAILCMHGGGASPDIFRFQTSSLHAALAHEYDFFYASAPHVAEPGPDVLPFFAGMDPFYSWFRPVHDDPAAEVDTFNEAVRGSVESYARHNPGARIVGVLGFSQGAVAATMLLWQRQVGRLAWLPDVKFGVLLCPGYSAVATGYMRDICEREGLGGDEGVVVKLPTLHMHGRQDVANLPQSRRMYATHYKGAKLVEFDGEHEVPRRVGDVKKLVDYVLGIPA
ncbi:oxidoreductase [Colletotrichum cereale]|nr:oxidoreductase [Colletotrichum cereale]